MEAVSRLYWGEALVRSASSGNNMVDCCDARKVGRELVVRHVRF